MIKLTRPPVPPCLSAQEVDRLTKEFKATGNSVWDIPALKAALATISNNKCGYCESPLGTRSAMMEVEHFKSKKRYPDYVVAWDNLLPCCRRCNGKKGNHDVLAEPMIDPTSLDPRAHIKFERLRYAHKTAEGETTLEVLEYNDDVAFMVERYKLCLKVENSLEELSAAIAPAPEVKALRRTKRRLKALLNQAQPTESFSATVASVVATNTHFAAIRTYLQQNGEWDDELARLYQTLVDIAL